jgi:hypothetical protein
MTQTIAGFAADDARWRNVESDRIDTIDARRLAHGDEYESLRRA